MRERTINRRNIEFFLLLIAGLSIGGLFLRLYHATEKELADVPGRLQDGSMVNLDGHDLTNGIHRLLSAGYYLEDPRDVQLATNTMVEGLNKTGPIDNLGTLNKSAFSIPVETAALQGGPYYQKRARLAYQVIGFSGPDSVFLISEKKSPQPLPAVNNLESGNGSIKGEIKQRDGSPAAGVLVRLEPILPQDSSYVADEAESDQWFESVSPQLRRTYRLRQDGSRSLQSFVAFARTDAEGKYEFAGLSTGQAYELLPLQPGFSFGGARGVRNLDNKASIDFTRSVFTMKLFATRDFNILKKEKALIVRLPEEIRFWFWTIVASFFAGFFLIHFFLRFKLKHADPFILPVVMILTGLSLISLLSIQDPLRDRFLGRSTLYYLGGGFVCIFLLLLFNLGKFTQDTKLYRLFFSKDRRGERGLQWALISAGLLILTIVFGSGPEGSGVKVNLFGFQPSELIKYFLLLFLAGFLATNETFISSYAEAGKRWRYFHIGLAAVVGCIFLFLLLGDLGPAVVICFTFIILFSFARQDLLVMAGAVTVYVLAVWLIKNVWIATAVAAVLLLVYQAFIYKRISESATMALAVIACFLLLDQLPFPDNMVEGPLQRLQDRKAIWENKWENEVFGGDHVANGIWAMSSGGVTGQGIGEGFAKTIPEAHTDMILPAIGEELGWMGMLCIFLLFLVYLHRSVLIGRQTGRPFLFYLCAGIGISTFVQFLLIAGGSTGALPLSGIALPFVSFGGSSLMVNMAAAGFLLSASFVKGSSLQLERIYKKHDRNLNLLLFTACLGLLLLIINLSTYLFQPAQWVVQPALVADRSGARIFSYNPRIAILMNRLEAGSIYDRDGRLLATSKVSQLLEQRQRLTQSGVQSQELIALSRKRYDRYYPFGDHMFFWTGDANTGVFNGSLNGFFGEYRLQAELRGFSTNDRDMKVNASRFREHPLLPAGSREMNVVYRDYSALSSMLLAGVNSAEVDSFKKRNRDVQLSMDAALQTALQNGMAIDDSLRNKRVSIVVIEDSTGDVLSSAMWPLPPADDFEALTMSQREQAQFTGWLTLKDLGFTHATQPGSTAKLATALAALNKYGTAAARKTFLIREQDLIRVRSVEPDEPGMINMERALVKSNNSYFIKLANETRIEEDMASIYLKTGMFLRGLGGYFYERGTIDPARENAWLSTWRKTEFASIKRYNPQNIRKTRGVGISGMAWGQGELVATPASIARLVSGISNHGMMVPHHFVLKISDSTLPSKPPVQVAGTSEIADLLAGFMKQQSAGKRQQLGMAVAGKTGTPERILKGRRINDGWYVFFAPKEKGSGHIVVCIRIEVTKGSSDAVRLAGSLVIPELLKRGYIKGFDAEAESN